MTADGSGGRSCAWALAFSVCLFACGENEPPNTVVVASVVIAQLADTLLVGDTVPLVATARDSQEQLLTGRVITWAASPDSVARVSSTGHLAALGVGTATVTATAEGTVGKTAIGVFPIRVASVAIGNVTTSPYPGATASPTVTILDQRNRPLTNRLVQWSTSDTAVATVTASGMVTFRVPGIVTVRVTVEGPADSAVRTVSTLSFGQVSSSKVGTCGLTVEGRLYCWGAIAYGATVTPQNPPAPVLGAGGMAFAKLTTDGEFNGYGYHACAVDSLSMAWCWGDGHYGDLGDGTTIDQVAPVPVSGSLTFAELSLGADYTCGLRTAGQMYCWGNNTYGQFGTGDTLPSLTPKLAAQGSVFSQLTVGHDHACGVSSGVTYCWGANANGQLGDSSTTRRLTPVRVASGSVAFSQVQAGGKFTCALTAAGAAWCWGGGNEGQLGYGALGSKSSPVAVLGGLSFASVTVSRRGDFGEHACAVTSAGVGYCWGENGDGQGGNGTGGNVSTTPKLVSGGYAWLVLAAGGLHSCGVTTSHIAYCWGYAGFGQLGNGQKIPDTVTPVKVRYQQ